MASISLKNVCLNYPVYGKKNINSFITNQISVGGTIVEKNKFYTIEALKNLSIDFRDGDKVGLIGHNGAGKSTLLKLAAGIYPISSGSMSISGKVQSLFDPRAGLEPEEDGIKNIKRLTLLLNQNFNLIKKKIPEIIQNSELGDYINFPVKTYSDGMKLRLCFSVITSWKSDIFLVDEFLSVGDEKFHIYAKKKLNNIIEKASIVLLASHNLAYIEALTNRLVILNSGKVEYDGKTKNGLDYYKSLRKK